MRRKNLDEEIVDVLRSLGRPASTETLSILLKRDVRDVNEHMPKLEKYGEIRKKTSRKIDFFGLA